MTFLECEKSLRGWRQEFRSGATLGLKAMRGLLNKELWGEVEREGIEALTAKTEDSPRYFWEKPFGTAI